MINVGSFVEPLSNFPILPYLVQVLRCVIGIEISEEDQDRLDVWLESLDARGRLTFMIGDCELCKIPLRVLQHAEASFLSRTN